MRRQGAVCGLILCSLLFGSGTTYGQTYRLLLRRAHCWTVIQQAGIGTPAADPTTVALLSRISTQQEILAQQLIALQARPLTVGPTGPDPTLVALVQQLVVQQDRVLTAVQQGRVSDPAVTGLLQQLVTGQQQLLVAISSIPRPAPCPALPPIVVTPSPNPTPIVVTPPTVVPIPAAGLGALPGAGGALQVIPGPGGSISVLPGPGGTLQAIPGPGGTIQVLPGGVAAPGGSKPPDSGGTIIQIPGGGSVIPSLPGVGSPMTPLPGVGGSIPGPSYRQSTVYRGSRTDPWIDPRLAPRR